MRQDARARYSGRRSPDRKSRSFSWNNSRVGKAISDKFVRSGVASCLSGGRRMVKCTRSTDGSALSRLRHTRSPACGSPETSSTRSRSRTPDTVTTARLFCKRQFGGARRGRQLDDILAFMGDRHLDVGVLAHRHHARAQRLAVDADVDIGAGRRRRRRDRPPAAASAPHLADNGEARGIDDGQLAVAFAALARDQHLQRRVQVMASGAGASCTSPSVIMMAPAIRLGGTSASAAFSAAKAWVPLFSPVVVVVTLVSRTDQVGLRCQQLPDLLARAAFGLRRRARPRPCSASGR